METTAFPPLNALMISLSKIDYKKHLNNLITIALFIAAVSYVFYQRISAWYKESGKETIIQVVVRIGEFLIATGKVIVSVFKFLKVSYTSVSDLILQTYHNWQGLMTVA